MGVYQKTELLFKQAGSLLLVMGPKTTKQGRQKLRVTSRGNPNIRRVRGRIILTLLLYCLFAHLKASSGASQRNSRAAGDAGSCTLLRRASIKYEPWPLPGTG